ncbi:MAG: sortase [Clostridia bacterium]|nr:sortase [Clostridia bacterium]
MFNRNLKKRILLAALILAAIAAIVTATILISGKNRQAELHNSPKPTMDYAEIYTPLESYYAQTPSETAHPTPNALNDRFKRTLEPKQTPTSPSESGAPEVATTKLPRETPYASASITPNANPNTTDIPAQPTPSATSSVHGKDFTLTILGQHVPVSVGVDRPTLAQNPGWLETSAYPGEEGVCVVYGHRNRNHLKVLKDIDFGDTISVTLEDGTSIRYNVASIKVLESDNELRVPLLSGQHIMLTTCYPFYYTGHAPGKMVVIGTITT